MTTVPIHESVSTFDDYGQRVSVRALLRRSIYVYFPQPIAIVGGDGAPGVVEGFAYNDDLPADEDPTYDARLPGVPSMVQVAPQGHLFRKDGKPRQSHGWAFSTPANRAVTDWCAKHPNWWKPTPVVTLPTEIGHTTVCDVCGQPIVWDRRSDAWNHVGSENILHVATPKAGT